MHRFFVTPGSLGPEGLVDLDAHARQMHSVLRLAAGTRVIVLDGSGMEHMAQLVEIGARRARAQIETSRLCPGEPTLEVTLYQCSLKGEKFEWVLQKGTELGVRRFVPVVSARSIVRPLGALARKGERWQAVIREAAEQAHRGRLPELSAPLDFAQAISSAQGLRLLPWEETGAGAAIALGRGPVSLLIGPEGGLEAAEAEAARAAGWQVASLGTRILRAETAAIASVAALMALGGELGSLAAPRRSRL